MTVCLSCWFCKAIAARELNQDSILLKHACLRVTVSAAALADSGVVRSPLKMLVEGTCTALYNTCTMIVLISGLITYEMLCTRTSCLA